MPDTSTLPTDTVPDVDVARELVSKALVAYADNGTLNADDAALASAMAENVRGWTHTTRLRDFLQAVSA